MDRSLARKDPLFSKYGRQLASVGEEVQIAVGDLGPLALEVQRVWNSDAGGAVSVAVTKPPETVALHYSGPGRPILLFDSHPRLAGAHAGDLSPG